MKPLKIVCNAGNGGAGAVIDALEPFLPFEWVKVHHHADGNFDTQGNFVESYYIVDLLAEAFLKKHSPEKIVHDPRLVWNTIELTENLGGEAVQSKTGHAFIKKRMRQEDAVYGGEMSAHHYFRDFAYCDSRMIPWLLVAELICTTRTGMAELAAERAAKFPCRGEINRRLSDAATTLARTKDHFRASADNIDYTDGLSMDFGQWRFNLRTSNTEPVIRLNVESRADRALMEEKTAYILSLMED